MLDIISFGDATVDMFLNISEATVTCDVHKENCQLCFSYADKIPVDSIVRIPGAGNGSNNAVGSARLGMSTGIATIIGNDGVGEQIIRAWKKEGVNTKFVVIDKKRETNYSTVLNFRGERTILVYHEKRDYVFPTRLVPAKWIYYTSLGMGSERMHDGLIKYIKKTGAKLVFQPGTFQIKLGKEGLIPLISIAEVLILNKEEAQRVLRNDSRDVKILLTAMHGLGARIVVITDGPVGSYLYDGERYLFLGIFDVPVVERTGCGDAFATAFVAALHCDKSVEEAMRWGTANSASVLGFVGPQKGLLKHDEMMKFLKRFPEKPKKI